MKDSWDLTKILRSLSLMTDEEQEPISPSHTGPYLIALLASIIQKIQLNDFPLGYGKDIQQALLSAEKLIGYQKHHIASLYEQQLRWAVDYLMERLTQDGLIPKPCYRKIQHNFGDFQIKSIAHKTFSFFDEQTSRIAGCVNKGFHEIQCERALAKK